jgi:catechol 2,3-dioxygenase-like lactoylglutathione lyase family enzyme
MMYIQHISIPRPPGPESREQALAFYGRLLGMTPKPEPKSIQYLDLVWFQVGEMELHCFAEEPMGDKSGRHFCLVVDDVAEMRQKLSTAGYEIQETDAIPGRPRFFCHDPFGNRIEITTIVADYMKLEE